MKLTAAGVLMVAVFTLTWSGLAEAGATENEAWISPKGPAKTNGAGSTEDPFRCPDWASLQAVLGLGQFDGNTTFHLMAGTFEVAPPGIVPKTGWKLRGAGMDNTILRLKDNTATNSTVLVFGYARRSDGAEVSDLTVDCNLQNQRTRGFNIAAAELRGSDTRISRVKAINWGTTGRGVECFVISIFSGATNEFLTNCIIEDCTVTSPAPVRFADGVSCFTVTGDGPNSTGNVAGGLLRNNLVENIPSGGGAPGSPVYVNAFSGYSTIRDNRVINVPGGVGVYRDSWNGGEVVVEDNVFDKVGRGVWFLMPYFDVTGLVIKNNVIRPVEGGMGIGYETAAGHFVRNLVIQNNTVYPAAGATNILPLSLNPRGGRIAAMVTNNVFQAARPLK